MWYDTVVAESIGRYTEHLNNLAANDASTPPQRALAARIIALNHAALAEEHSVPLVTAAHVALLPVTQRLPLLNPFGLGYGAPPGVALNGRVPKLMIFGTEHAYDLSNDVCVAAEGIAASAMWGIDASSDQWAEVGGIPLWAELPPFHRDPSHHFGILPPGHTWRKLALAVTGGSTMAHVRDLTACAYIMELSATPALQAHNGAPVPETRLKFLLQIAHSAGTLDPKLGCVPVRTMLFHGQGRMWNETGIHVMRAFLGFAQGVPTPEPAIVTVGAAKLRIYASEDGTKRVLHTCAGAHRVRREYWSSVHAVLTQPH